MAVRGVNSSVRPAHPGRSRPMIVVAEDGLAERTMLALLLHHRGFDTVLAADGHEALEAAVVHQPDAVVSDMNMPRLDGLGLCRALRALPDGDIPPIIVWSSVDAHDPRVLEAVALGGVAFFSKSFPVTGIDAALRHALTPAQLEFAS